MSILNTIMQRFRPPNLTPYRPHQHVTVQQLRRLGFYLPENLPDQAYVRRIAVGLNPTERLNDGTASVGLQVLDCFCCPVACG
jgi:hypothetical protein